MYFDVIAPATAPQIPPPNHNQPQPPRLDEVDHEIIAAFRKEGIYGDNPWSVFNKIVAAENPGSRADAQAMRRELWQRVKRLLRAGVLHRCRRNSVTTVKLAKLTARRRRRRWRGSTVNPRRTTTIEKTNIALHGKALPPISAPTPTPAIPAITKSAAVVAETRPEAPMVCDITTALVPLTDEQRQIIRQAATSLALLPRQQKRQWTGWLHSCHMWRGAPVILPGGQVARVYGILRGFVLIKKEPPLDGTCPFIGYEARQVRTWRNPSAVNLGMLKAGIKERPSERKKQAARRNGRMPVKAGSRPRGRPRKPRFWPTGSPPR
jgi:hypothetical protein